MLSNPGVKKICAGWGREEDEFGLWRTYLPWRYPALFYLLCVLIRKSVLARGRFYLGRNQLKGAKTKSRDRRGGFG